MNPIKAFIEEKRAHIKKMSRDQRLKDDTNRWICNTAKHKYTYNFTWLGRPVIQFPQDIIAMQELIWSLKPDLIIETGIAHGGSLIFSASMLELMGGDGIVVGIDIDIRQHNKIEIEKHPMSKRIIMLEGSSVDEMIFKKVKDIAKKRKKIMVFLDSHHTHEHVLRELKLYSTFVSVGSYIVVFDTVIEDMPKHFFRDRPWGVGNNPKTAVKEFLKTSRNFIIDKTIPDKLLITVAPDGYLRRMR